MKIKTYKLFYVKKEKNATKYPESCRPSKGDYDDVAVFNVTWEIEQEVNMLVILEGKNNQ
jgi:hypothetical protein